MHGARRLESSLIPGKLQQNPVSVPYLFQDKLDGKIIDPHPLVFKK
jgi:hypothetical protein